MARSHMAVAFASALFAALLISHFVVTLGFPKTDSWHSRLDQDHKHREKTHLYSGKQANDAADDPSQYLIGVGKADITG